MLDRIANAFGLIEQMKNNGRNRVTVFFEENYVGVEVVSHVDTTFHEAEAASFVEVIELVFKQMDLIPWDIQTK